MNGPDLFSEARESMVFDQIMRRGIDNERVLEAFRYVPRHLFVPDESRDQAYMDHPIPIGAGQTISQPYIVALMTKCLDLTGTEKVLEIGTGSGYQTAILGQLAREVYSVELIVKLSQRANIALSTIGNKNIHLEIGDGSAGLKKYQPYDRIIITAAVPSVSQETKDQVVIGGKIVAPVGDRWRQALEVWTKQRIGFDVKKILPVVFVPMRGKYGWQD